ncbi:unnamed protein product [Calypogeia fissa]
MDGAAAGVGHRATSLPCNFQAAMDGAAATSPRKKIVPAVGVGHRATSLSWRPLLLLGLPTRVRGRGYRGHLVNGGESREMNSIPSCRVRAPGEPRWEPAPGPARTHYKLPSRYKGAREQASGVGRSSSRCPAGGPV